MELLEPIRSSNPPRAPILVDGVHGIVRVHVGVVLRQRRYHRPHGIGHGGCSFYTSLDATEVRAVCVITQTEGVVDEVSGRARIRHHGARQTQLVVACHREEVELTLGAADQHIGTRDVAAACQVEADERYLAGPRGDAAGTDRRLDIGRERGVGHPRVAEDSQQRRCHDGGCAGQEPLSHEFAASSRARVILQTERFVQTETLGRLLTHKYRPLRFFSCLIDQHVGAAEGRGAGRRSHTGRSSDVVRTWNRAGAKLDNHLVELAVGAR